MKDDSEDDFEELAKKFPDLMQKSRQDYIDVGAGWFHIIEVLCEQISLRVERARSRLKFASENPDANMGCDIFALEAELKEALEELPTISQIKEKFGSLRFYMDGGTDEMRNHVEFAEAMSMHCCETCGAPGKRRSSGWIKTLCDAHHEEAEEISSTYKESHTRRLPKLSDEN